MDVYPGTGDSVANRLGRRRLEPDVVDAKGFTAGKRAL